jgi:hypothetical protein
MNSTSQTIHWVGAGLSSVPGIRTLAASGRPLTVWNRTLDKARAAIAGVSDRARAAAFSMEQLGASVQPGDIVVSMLPGDWHLPLAELCLERDAHFVSSSYLTDAMHALDARAGAAGLCLVNEVGLDPGIDHLMAHQLVRDYRASGVGTADTRLSFRSYCGGFPAIPNDFRYKFSWSPLGVLKALRSPARSIREGRTVVTERPWHAVAPYTVEFGSGRRETFEAYPNRDSLPFMSDYRFDPDWAVEEFVRGTLRLDGWADAWADIFSEVEVLSGSAGDARLAELSDALWRDYAYDEGEADRVVLAVELEATMDGAPRWHQSWVIDAVGNAAGSAMARLVSNTVALAVAAVTDRRIRPGVSTAPSEPALIEEWFESYRRGGDEIIRVDHLAHLA